MALLVSILILLMLGLGLFQAWQLWFTRRELARLEQRVAESLDDQDLLEFQDRLRDLLAETKDAGMGLVQSIEIRQAALEGVIDQAADVEKKLSMRTQLLELAARELSKPVALPAKPKAPAKKPLRGVDEGRDEPTAPLNLEKQAPSDAADAGEAAREETEEARRSYLSRPAPASASPNRYRRVYELADQGLTQEQIAREAGLLPGEIELILNLRPGKKR
jgi:hypothetical protein